jgi:hypothetical protein
VREEWRRKKAGVENLEGEGLAGRIGQRNHEKVSSVFLRSFKISTKV